MKRFALSLGLFLSDFPFGQFLVCDGDLYFFPSFCFSSWPDKLDFMKWSCHMNLYLNVISSNG